MEAITKVVNTKPKQKIIGSIFETYNYDLFTLISENREINHTNVDRLVKSMKVKINICPIIVDSKFRVIDGQHRLAAFRLLKEPVIYIVDKDATIDDIQRLNSVSKTWSQKEYLRFYMKRGYKNYKIMHAFILKHQLTIKEAILYLHGSDSGESHRCFKNGLLDIKNIEKSNFFAKKINKIKSKNKDVTFKFFRVVFNLYNKNKIELDRFIHKLELNPSKLTKCSTEKQYKVLIEDIYNYKSRNKVNLRI